MNESSFLSINAMKWNISNNRHAPPGKLKSVPNNVNGCPNREYTALAVRFKAFLDTMIRSGLPVETAYVRTFCFYTKGFYE
jgi:hypothetical protein